MAHDFNLPAGLKVRAANLRNRLRFAAGTNAVDPLMEYLRPLDTPTCNVEPPTGFADTAPRVDLDAKIRRYLKGPFRATAVTCPRCEQDGIQCEVFDRSDLMGEDPYKGYPCRSCCISHRHCTKAYKPHRDETYTRAEIEQELKLDSVMAEKRRQAELNRRQQVARAEDASLATEPTEDLSILAVGRKVLKRDAMRLYAAEERVDDAMERYRLEARQLVKDWDRIVLQR